MKSIKRWHGKLRHGDWVTFHRNGETKVINSWKRGKKVNTWEPEKKEVVH